MRKLRAIFNICLIGLPLFCLSQNSKRVNIEKFNISLELNENWEITKSNSVKYVHLENDSLKSTFRIENSDFKKTFKKIHLDIDSEALEVEINNILSNLDKTVDFEFNMCFSRIESKIKGNSKILTLYKTVNRNAYLIKANIPNNCTKCKEEFESIAHSIEQIQI